MKQNDQFDRIYDETRDELLRYIMLRTNAGPEAEDIFQETYRRFFVRLTHGVFPILDSRRYLFSIAKKELADYYSAAAKRKTLELPFEEDLDIAAVDEPIDERLFKEERMDEVWRLLQKEPDLDRKAFLLYYGYERSQKQIAAALGISEKAVRQRLYRTRGRIRMMLKQEEQEW